MFSLGFDGIPAGLFGISEEPLTLQLLEAVASAREDKSMDHFSIGEFSRMCGLPVKTLRFYHEKQLLVPVRVELDTGYRYYNRENLEVAQVICALRRFDFSLETIAEILADRRDDGDILEFLEAHRQRLQGEIQHRDDILHSLDSIIARETNARTFMSSSANEVVEKTLSTLLIGGLRMKGRYSDCGKAFGTLGRKLGRHIGGKSMMLCYDNEFKEDDADFEPCMPLKREVQSEGVDVRELPGGRCISLIHHGPYDELSRSYGRIIEYAKGKGMELSAPSREVYIKGPGMIFKGNPKKYITELQFLLVD
ncbi:MAG: DNA-binding transcriptional MerR regulator/effector-binding domain-containing protein [Planctomycetota bacterium]